jgi:hypothetical protein
MPLPVLVPMLVPAPIQGAPAMCLYQRLPLLATSLLVIPTASACACACRQCPLPLLVPVLYQRLCSAPAVSCASAYRYLLQVCSFRLPLVPVQCLAPMPLPSHVPVFVPAPMQGGSCLVLVPAPTAASCPPARLPYCQRLCSRPLSIALAIACASACVCACACPGSVRLLLPTASQLVRPTASACASARRLCLPSLCHTYARHRLCHRLCLPSPMLAIAYAALVGYACHRLCLPSPVPSPCLSLQRSLHCNTYFVPARAWRGSRSREGSEELPA